MAGKACCGSAGRVCAWLVTAWFGRRGMLSKGTVSCGELRRGKAGEVRSGLVRSGELWQGEAGRGMAGEASCGKSSCGLARLAGVRQVRAWQAWKKGGKAMVYKWKTVNYSVPANVVGKYFEELEASKGLLTNQIVLDGARAESSPIHPLFEWDDQIAAEQYRLNQATKLICNLTVEIETEDKPIEVRAYMNVSEQKTGEFINTTQAFKSADSREIVLKRAYQELEAFKQKYKNLTELAKVFEAIDELKTPA